MNNHHKIKLIVLNLVVLMSLFTSNLFAKTIQAQTLEVPIESENQENIIESYETIEFKTHDAPDSNRSGSKRNNFCNQDNLPIPFMALFPNNKQYHLTSMNKPTFYVYLPETTVNEGHFLLINYETKEEIYHGTIPLTDSNGIMSIKLPDDAPLLEDNTIYKWRFGLLCEENSINNSNSNGAFVEGLIKKVDLVIAEEGELSLNQAQFYAENGVWYDTLNVLMELHKLEPENQEILHNLHSLLRQGELDENLINEEILPHH